MDAVKYLEKDEETYDKILLDVPCSAEGRISLQNEKSYGFWSLENIQKKAELQYSLLIGAWKRLKK
jgi:16S rRNA C967 or C1407 C5-methylase (RsmB/RsmF family)